MAAIVAIVLLLAIGGFVIGLVMLVRRASRKQQAKFERLADGFSALGQKLGGRGAAGSFNVQLGDQRFSARLVYHKNQPIAYEITSSINERLRDPGEAEGGYRSDPRRIIDGYPIVLLRQETSLDRLGKKLGINREIQVGDQEFDAAVYIESDAGDVDLEKIFVDGRVRRGVQDLLSMGFKQVGLNQSGMEIVARRELKRLELPAEDELTRSCEHLRRITGALPVFSGQYRKARVHLPSVLLITSSVVLGFGSLIALALVRQAYYPLTREVSLAGVLSGALVFLLSAPVLAWVLRGKSTSFRRLIACLAILLPSLPLFFTDLTTSLNGALDEAPAFEARSLVLSTRIQRSKNSTRYYARVSGWHEGQGSVEIPISWQLYRSVSTGDHVVLTVGPGRFGWEWLREIHRAN